VWKSDASSLVGAAQPVALLAEQVQRPVDLVAALGILVTCEQVVEFRVQVADLILEHVQRRPISHAVAVPFGARKIIATK